jgi:hypothetical protein
VTMKPNEDWFTCLPPCHVEIPCGTGRHVIRWEAGALRLESHADPEAELVLAALGGEKARCVEVAEAWSRHAADPTVLRIGPRGADGIAVTWEDVDAVGQGAQGGVGPGWIGQGAGPGGPGGPGGLGGLGGPGGLGTPGGLGGPGGPGGMRRTSVRLSAVMAQASARRSQLQREHSEARERQTDLLSLLALGPAFQVRLAGQVVAAYAARLDEPDERGRSRRPVLTAALGGRLAPVAERWLGIDPDQVEVSLHTGPGWGSAGLTGSGAQRRLRVSLPADWVARVWACGLALTGRHLVVAVDRAGWPDARVLALRAPGTEPVLLDVHARPGEESGETASADGPHWEV